MAESGKTALSDRSFRSEADIWATRSSCRFVVQRRLAAKPSVQSVHFLDDPSFDRLVEWSGEVCVPPVIAAFIPAFAQYALDSRARGGGGPVPSRLGRWNGVAYYALLAVPLVRDALALPAPGPGSVRVLGWILVASTLLSMALRLRTSLRR